MSASQPEPERPHTTRCFQWVPTDDEQLERAEARMLAALKTPFTQRHVAGLNTITSTAAAADGPTKHVVLMHGFGGGVAHWIPTFDFLARQEPPAPFQRVVVHAVDMPGAARSNRDGLEFDGAQAAIDHVVGGLAAWFAAMGFDVPDPVKTDAEKKKQKAAAPPAMEAAGDEPFDEPFSPAIVPPSCGASSSPLADGDLCALVGNAISIGDIDIATTPSLRCDTAQPFVADSLDIVGHSFGAYMAAQFTMRYPSMVKRLVLADSWGLSEMVPNTVESMPLKFRFAMGLLGLGTPFSSLRKAGPWGPGILPKRRPDFAERWGPIVGDPLLFFDYLYHCNAKAVPASEVIFKACSEGPAFARQPLCFVLPRGVPAAVQLHFVFGADTWMNLTVARAVRDACVVRRGAGAVNGMTVIEDAGHQVATDQPEEFNAALAKALF
jgi:pimeloyl-ACP methyl ester carboxylesterase